LHIRYFIIIAITVKANTVIEISSEIGELSNLKEKKATMKKTFEDTGIKRKIRIVITMVMMETIRYLCIMFVAALLSIKEEVIVMNSIEIVVDIAGDLEFNLMKMG